MSAQNQGFCEPFDQFNNTSPAGPGCNGVATPNVLDNWGVINTDINYTDNNSQNGAGDRYLYMDDGSCGNGASFIYNAIDYAGNWMAMTQDEGCFCYDFRTFHIQTGTLSGSSLRIYDGPDPQSSTVSAVFTLNIPVDPSRGWVRICAPIDFADAAGNLPGNSDGTWVINSGGAAAWNSLISNVGSIAYLVDVAGGDERFGIDNICISQDCDSTFTEEPPTEDGSYCCDESENLMTNGNFEFGNTGFTSSYSQNGATLPGQYDVTDSASAFGANITDHSFCEDPIAYATNDKFLLVNGKTTQPAGTVSEIYRKSLNLDENKEYRFCANFKNMPQCTFDILPEIEIVTTTGFSQTAVIDVDPTDPCAWQSVSFCFTGGEDMDFRILLKEDGLGDGNDLAIDDIAVSELADPELTITVQHQGNPQQITGSINTISTGDDVLPFDTEICEEPWYWFVATVDNYSGGSITIDFADSYGWGNDTGYSIFNPGTSGATPWNLTTVYNNFPFDQNKLYIVGMYSNSCCVDCYDEGFTYQLTYNNRIPSIPQSGLNPAHKQRIISMLGRYAPTIGSRRDGIQISNNISMLNVSPNPATSIVTVRLENNTVNQVVITTMSGNIVKDDTNRNSNTFQEVNVEGLASGMYLVKATAADGSMHTSKLIIE
ncbi:hypothetical protein ULMS_21110 [Patiriisocius marinistellae]|uniref:Secretion system C-terminal sorting domain-containing protein n=2 Tax=Patiriisocius marinistellae TaxID=2494560 RepID=A0A5J4FX37_9FLAO|nr:hypothetical protein ULMS_21110 [Patiriisocius marinistellae]